jgi:hypothetical protein
MTRARISATVAMSDFARQAAMPTSDWSCLPNGANRRRAWPSSAEVDALAKAAIATLDNKR